MLGIELPEWRKRNRFTQDGLRLALGVGSRQTIITWEKSSEPLSRLVELALLALEHFPEERNADGARFPNARTVHDHVWAEREYPSRRVPESVE
jgi:DNA-binding XRE family transcriptional regulator